MEEGECKQQLLILGRLGAASQLWFSYQLIQPCHVGLQTLQTGQYRVISVVLNSVCHWQHRGQLWRRPCTKALAQGGMEASRVLASDLHANIDTPLRPTAHATGNLTFSLTPFIHLGG